MTHNGTHLDAPYHFASTMNGGERAITIDEVPLDWCFQPGVKLDFRHLPDGYVATADDVEPSWTASATRWRRSTSCWSTRARARPTASPDYVAAGCGMGREATLYLLERGVRLTGTDAWSWDAPFVHTHENYAETTMPASSGKATRRAARSAIATSRSCTISRRCRRTGSRCAASR